MKGLRRVVVGTAVLVMATLGMQSAHAIPDYWKVSSYGADVFFGVNDHGDAVGYGGVDQLPAVHYAGQGTTIVSAPGWEYGQMESVNASGVAVGWVVDSSGDSRAVAYDHGVIKTLGFDARAHGINDAGVIAMTEGHNAFLVAPNGTKTQLPQADFTNAVVMDVAKNNWATGQIFQLTESGNQVNVLPVIWDPSGNLHVMELPNGFGQGLGYRINASGTAIGFVYAADHYSSVVWRNLNPVAQSLNSSDYEFPEATGINDSGDISGLLHADGAVPPLGVVWRHEDGVPVVVAQRMNPLPKLLQVPEDISNNGTMAGTQASTDTLRASVWTPQVGVLVHLKFKIPAIPASSVPIPDPGPLDFRIALPSAVPLGGPLEVFNDAGGITLPTLRLP
jgi:hypothetical protein